MEFGKKYLIQSKLVTSQVELLKPCNMGKSERFVCQMQTHLVHLPTSILNGRLQTRRFERQHANAKHFKKTIWIKCILKANQYSNMIMLQVNQLIW